MTSNCTLPEGRTLSSQISVTSQLGNLVPLLYRAIVKYCCSSKKKDGVVVKEPLCTCARPTRVPAVIVISMATGLFSAVLAAFYWDTATYIFGTADFLHAS